MIGTENDLRVFATRVRRARQARHLSQVALAEQVGISNKQLNNIENFHNWPSVPVFIALCRALEITDLPAA